MTSDIKWIRDTIKEFKEENSKAHETMITHLANLNGAVDDNQNRVIKLEQNQKAHFYMHDEKKAQIKVWITFTTALLALIGIIIKIISMR